MKYDGEWSIEHEQREHDGLHRETKRHKNNMVLIIIFRHDMHKNAFGFESYNLPFKYFY